ncbi:MAG: NAD(P)H-dependent glycerol-3-phosphate dehydrogenase [Halofilum sp. (in: g-proteobacteria)]
MSDSPRVPITVLGAGAWGTALAAAMVRNGLEVMLWGRDPQLLADITERHENPRYLPGITLPAIVTEADLDTAVARAEALVFATPSYTFREMLRRVAPTLNAGKPFAWACKGIEPETDRLIHEIVAEELARPPAHAVLSGPSFARELAAELPTALTVAAPDSAFAARAVGWLHGGALRAYSSPDVTGVELAGALKNVLAIACGASDGLGFGANARAAVITRGLAELMRLGESMGAQRETFMGLAGIGDLVLTCTDDQSRNRRFGLAIARGLSAEAACAEIGQAVEGLRTARAAAELARRCGVEMPIVAQVDAVLHGGRDVREAVRELLERDPKAELAH